MLRNHLTLTLRTIRRQAGYVGLNVIGLSLGLAACLLIGLFVRDELSYDRFHVNADRIVRVTARINVGPTFTLGVPDPAGPYLTEHRPEVESFLRIHDAGPQIVHVGAERIEETGFLEVDPNFFDVFSFDVVRGDARTALSRPGTVLVTPGLARRYFEEMDPIGRRLQLSDSTSVEIAGLIAPPPHNSVIQYQAILPQPGPPDDTWDLRSSGTYLLLRTPNDVEALEAALPDILVERYGGRIQSAEVDVERLTDLYLHAERGISGGESGEHLLRGDAKYVYAFGIAAILILLVACVNYVNLATARSAQRAREVGVRKSVGAARGQLVRQFLTESAVLTFLSLCVAALWVDLLLPGLNALTDKSMRIDYLGDPAVLLLFAGVGLVVTLGAGLYPAAVLSSFRPIEVLRRAPSGSRGRLGLRRGLVAFQFAISAVLLLCTAVMQRQLDFLSEKDLGFAGDQVVQLAAVDGDRYAAYKTALQGIPGVQSVSIAQEFPGMVRYLVGFEEDDPMTPGDRMTLPLIETDHDFLRTMDIPVVAGRFFDPDRTTDGGETVVLNVTGARAFGWEPQEAPGQAIDRGSGNTMPVIGVVEDFHLQSLRYGIEPLALRLTEDRRQTVGHVLVRIAPDLLTSALEALRNQHANFVDDTPFTFTFLDDAFAAEYEAEQRLRSVSTAFSVLALVIAALGVLGLVSHAAERRTKEIGIRKVLGATERSIVGLLSRELLLLVVAGFAVASPLAYFGMSRWLEEFAYHIDPGAGQFFIVGVGLLATAIIATGTQALRAARANPVTALRSE